MKNELKKTALVSEDREARMPEKLSGKENT